MAGVRSAVAALAMIVVLAAPARATSSPFSCEYTFTSWTGVFIAELTVVNHGPPVTSWEARWSFPTETALLGVWNTRITQLDPYRVIATGLIWNNAIPTAGTMKMGWTARAATTGAPADLTVNGLPC
ncbi:cellulose binding domain-containing protein [Acrocarpospora catenulata]|uniref:cellulose binding domain-containing protein n=1 Tax=Acrocarpospora catenulata TaxID=2836182 RepID=UPI001BDAF5BD|nr:cellulose binding domain-containing protein [Acrocarpospora catenulata]